MRNSRSSNWSAQHRLPPPPAPADNAAMDADPPISDPPKRKRRWYQFSLRTLLIGVSLLAAICGYVKRQYEIVQERQSFFEQSVSVSCAGTNPEGPDVPWIRSLLGDRGYAVIGLVSDTERAERQRAAVLFPEALICAVRFPHIPGAPLNSCGIECGPFADEPAWPQSDHVPPAPPAAT